MGVNFGQYTGHEILERSGSKASDRLVQAIADKKKSDDLKEEQDRKFKLDAQRLAKDEADSLAISTGFVHDTAWVEDELDADGNVVKPGHWSVSKTDTQYEPYRRQDEQFEVEQSGYYDHDNDPATPKVPTLAMMNQQGLLTGAFTDKDGVTHETYAKKHGDRTFEQEFAENQYTRLSDNAEMGDILDSQGNVIVKDWQPQSYKDRVKEENYAATDQWLTNQISTAIKDNNFDSLDSLVYGGGIEEYAKAQGYNLDASQLQTLENTVYNNVEKALKKIDSKYAGKDKDYIKKNLTDKEKKSYQNLYMLKNNASIQDVADFISKKTVKGTNYADTYGYTKTDMNWAKDIISSSDKYQENIVGNKSIWADPDFYLTGSGWSKNNEDDTMLVAAMKPRLEAIYNYDSGLSDTWIRKDGPGMYSLVEDDPLGNDELRLKMGSDGPMVEINGNWVYIDESLSAIADEI